MILLKDFTPLTENERNLLGHVQMFGSKGYPVKKLGRGWNWEGFGVKGPPVVFKTKTKATEHFELWMSLKREALGAEAFNRSVEEHRASGFTDDEIQAKIDAAEAYATATADPE